MRLPSGPRDLIALLRRLFSRVGATRNRSAPGTRTVTLSVLLAVYLVVTANGAFWRAVLGVVPPDSVSRVGFLLSLIVFMVALLTLLFALVGLKYTFKPAAITLLITAAIASHYLDAYGILIDRTMIQGVLETDTHETLEVITWRLIVRVIFLGLVPAFLVSRIRLRPMPILRSALTSLGLAFVSLAVMLVCAFSFQREYASFARNNGHTRHLLVPINYIYAVGWNIKRVLGESSGPMVAVGATAYAGPGPASSGKKTLIILVLGETARAGNFSLNGYARETNPLLKTEEIVSFGRVFSCGTATATSLPCMFSKFGRAEYDDARGRRYENLLDVLTHAGIRVLWRDNNTGCKNLCDRVENEDMSNLKIPEICIARECYDDILLHNLQKYVNGLRQDGVIVLHQNGSHGPGYYLRYPAKFKVFRPECETSELQECAPQQIVNAYDNSILYTDYFLERVIEFLKTNTTRFDTAMVYVSDHGESLGENGIYLHGLPYLIAPEEQKHIPFITWFSKGFESRQQLDRGCIASRRDGEYSHDNLFHSILGLMRVQTPEYDRTLDMFNGCRRHSMGGEVRAAVGGATVSPHGHAVPASQRAHQPGGR